MVTIEYDEEFKLLVSLVPTSHEDSKGISERFSFALKENGFKHTFGIKMGLYNFRIVVSARTIEVVNRLLHDAR